MNMSPKREGLQFARLVMVISSISPLFVLWAVRGTPLVDDRNFIGLCCALIVLPNCFLLLRLGRARKDRDTREIIVGKAEDHRDHLLVYLFAMLLPFYASSLNTWRELSATSIAVCFIVFLFWNSNLHYMNILFSVAGYRIFTIYPSADGNPRSGRDSFVLITRRAAISSGDRIVPFRLSNTVYWEVG
jgi:hypothetical protein